MDIKFSFDKLVESTRSIHNATAGWAKSAVNQSLTVRNWMIGCYIVEYEQNGNDRAEYGVRLLENLAERLSIKGLDRSMLNLCRLFYIRYNRLGEEVLTKLKKISGIDVGFIGILGTMVMIMIVVMVAVLVVVLFVVSFAK